MKLLFSRNDTERSVDPHSLDLGERKRERRRARDTDTAAVATPPQCLLCLSLSCFLVAASCPVFLFSDVFLLLLPEKKAHQEERILFLSPSISSCVCVRSVYIRTCVDTRVLACLYGMCFFYMHALSCTCMCLCGHSRCGSHVWGRGVGIDQNQKSSLGLLRIFLAPLLLCSAPLSLLSFQVRAIFSSFLFFVSSRLVHRRFHRRRCLFYLVSCLHVN